MENFKDTIMDLLTFCGWSVIIGIIIVTLFFVILAIIYVARESKDQKEDEEDNVLYDTTYYNEPEDRW